VACLPLLHFLRLTTSSSSKKIAFVGSQMISLVPNDGNLDLSLPANRYNSASLLWLTLAVEHVIVFIRFLMSMLGGGEPKWVEEAKQQLESELAITLKTEQELAAEAAEEQALNARTAQLRARSPG